MGGAALKELLGRRDRFDIVLLARPSKKNINKLKYLRGKPGVEIVWGDLTDYDSVREECSQCRQGTAQPG